MMTRRDAIKTTLLAATAVLLPTWSVNATTLDETYPFKLPELGYAYNALEPAIDAKTMEIHHSKHHAAYVNNLNAALEKTPEYQKKTLGQLLSNIDALPEGIRSAIRNNGGGHYNHALFWTLLKKDGPKAPTGELAAAIEKDLGGLDAFNKAFADAAAKRFGSGWAWLVVDSDGKLAVESSANQDSPVMEGKKVVLGIDVWEHAYYLNYQNRRGDYVKAFFDVIDWDGADARYKSFKK